MLKKFFQVQINNNKSKIINIFLVFFLSIFGFIVSDSLISNIDNSLSGEAKDVLGADIVVYGDQSLEQNQISFLNDFIQKYNLITTKEITFDTTILNKNGTPELVSLSFVEDNFPLYGELSYDVSLTLEGEDIETDLNKGILVDENTYNNFVQDNKLKIGEKIFSVRGIITERPGFGFSLFTSGRKAFIPIENVEETGLLTYGTRATYYYFFVDTDGDYLDAYEYLQDNKDFLGSYRVRDIKDRQDRVGGIISEFDDFIQIFLSSIFIISIICIFLSVESYFIANKKNFSLFNIFGMSFKKIIIYFSFFIFIIYNLAFLLAYLLSILSFVEIRSFDISQDFFLFDTSLIKGYIVGFIIMVLGVYYSFVNIYKLNPIEGLKPTNSYFLTKKQLFTQGVFVYIGLIIIYIIASSFSYKSFLYPLILLIGIFILSLIIKYLLLMIFTKIEKRKSSLDKNFSKEIYIANKDLSKNSKGQNGEVGIQKKLENNKKLNNTNFLYFDAIRYTVKPGNLSNLVIIPLVIIFISVFVVVAFALSLESKLQSSKVENNVFVINITDQAYNKIQEKYPEEDYYDIILGRISEINGKTLKDFLETEEVSRRFSREFNMTTNSLEDVEVLAGGKLTKGKVSVDSEFASDLGVTIGDDITFSIYGRELTYEVINIREAVRKGVSPFFYFQFDKGDFGGVPRTYFYSTTVASENIINYKKEIYNLVGPSVSVIDTTGSLSSLNEIISTIYFFMQIIFIYILIFALIILIVSMNFVRKLRIKHIQIYHILGLPQRFCDKHLFIEYSYLISFGFIFSLFLGIIISYFIISASSLLSFEIGVIFQSVGIIFLLYLLLIILIRFGSSLKK